MSRRSRRERRERTLAQVAYQGLMDLPTFRDWLYDLIEQRCATFGLSMDGPQVSGSLVAYREGRRSVGVELMQEAMRLTPERWATVLTERATALGQAMREAEQEQERAEAKAEAQEENTDG